MQFTCVHCQKPMTISASDLGHTAICPHCQAQIALPEAEPDEVPQEIQSTSTFEWWEGSISMLVSIVFHTALVIFLALVTYGGTGLGGTGTEVLIGDMPGERLTDDAATELSAEAVERAAEEATNDDTTTELTEVEPAPSNASVSEGEVLSVAAPSASGGGGGGSAGLEFDVAISGSGSGGAGGDWKGMIQTLRRNGLDVVIVFDSTASMGGEIDQVKSQIERIGTALIKLVPKTRISLCTYRDEGDDFVARGHPLTSNLQELTTFLDGVFASGGGDTPESVHAGMQWAATNNKFNPRSRKIMLIFGDSPPHAENLSQCLAIASDFRRQTEGIVSTVTCRSDERLPEFVEIAQVGGGEAFLTSDERQIMTQLMVLVFGGKHRAKVLEALELLRRD